jgi:hypothetical protein
MPVHDLGFNPSHSTTVHIALLHSTDKEEVNLCKGNLSVNPIPSHKQEKTYWVIDLKLNLATKPKKNTLKGNRKGRFKSNNNKNSSQT